MVAGAAGLRDLPISSLRLALMSDVERGLLNERRRGFSAKVVAKRNLLV
jgi:hypothetical protein